MVLNRVIGPTRKQLRDLGPSISKGFVSLKNLPVLLFPPRLLVNVGVEVVVPALPALLPNSARQMPCNQTPLLRTVLSDELDDLQVLFGGPRTFHQARLKYLLPSVEALNLSSISQFLGNLLPVASTVLLDSRTERIVLWGFLFGFEVDFLGRERRCGWGEMEWKGVDWREE